ncbi:MAG: choice-of-anchor I family protein [Bacteroidota bacterium]
MCRNIVDNTYVIVYNIPANTTENITIEVPVVDDALEDGGRYLILEITDVTDANLGSITRHNVLIVDNDAVIPQAQDAPDVAMNFLSSYKVGGEDGLAEILAHDPVTNRLFVTNSETIALEIVDYSDPSLPFMFASIAMADFDAEDITSAAFNAGTVAVAVPGEDVEENGRVLFFDVLGNFINEVEVGNLPDMVTFTPDGTKILTANEGEPDDDYDVDPVGSVSIIDLSAGVPNLTNADVTTLEFSVFDGDQAALEAAGVRIFGPGATVGQDLEPEFIAISEDGTTGYVTLQENNAVGVIDIENNMLAAVLPLGFKDHSLLANQLDASNTAPGIFSAAWDINGMYQPDAIDFFSTGGENYLITVNEGDARDYDGYSEETRLGDTDFVLDPDAFPFAEYIKHDDLLGRLNVTLATGDTDGDGDIDEIYNYGARSMTIWNATTGELVWDSGDDFEQITANDPVYGALFNASNSNNTFKNRSDDKGPEPEGVVVAEINGLPIAFVALERIGGVLAYNLSNPTAPEFIQYINTRSVDEEGGDLAPEGIIYIDAADSPTGNGLVVVAHEESGTIASFEVLTGPTAGFAEEAVAVAESVGTAQVEVIVEAAGGITGIFEASVNPASTAVEGVDFVFVSNPIIIPAGSTDPLNIEIDILNNSDETGGKYIILDISADGNVAPANEEQVVVLIQDDDKMAPAPNPEAYVKLNYVTSYLVDGDGGSAEILAYDQGTQRLFVVNSEKEEVEIVDFSDPTNPVEISVIDVAGFGDGLQSLDVFDGTLAVAVAGPAIDLPGRVVFFDTDGNLINQVDVGVLPDMVTFTPLGDRVITANEGEPDDDYVIDPEGSVSIIDLTSGVANITNADVTNVSFESFNAQIMDLQDAGVRIYGPNATVAQDLEPEYIVVSNDGTLAYAILQENNAAAVIDIASGTVAAIIPLGVKDWSLEPNTIDVSNEAPGIFFANWPIVGMYQPDAVDYFEVDGQAYLISANEGDARDYDGYSEEVRVKDDEYPLDPTVFPFAEELKNDNLLGRMKTTLVDGDIDGDGDYDQIYTYGARSITVWDAATGVLLWDSGDELERVTAADPVYGALFNSDNDENELKARSDDKGPEPEAIVVAEVDGQLFGFVGLERTGGLVSYDLNDPLAPEFVQYINTRDVNTEGGDLGPEDIKHIAASESPNGKHLLVVANEVSATVSIFEMDLNCPVDLGVDIEACEGETVSLTVEGNYETFTWSTGAETASIDVTIGDTYFVDVVSESGCVASDTIEVVFNGIPVVDLGVDTIVCVEDLPYVLDAGSGSSYLWNDNSTGSTLDVTETGTYSVVVTNIDGCEGSDEVNVEVTVCGNTDEIFANVQADLQPNPANEQTQLVLENMEAGRYNLEVVDVLGQVVYRTELNILGGTLQYSMETANMASGVYQVRLMNGNAQLVRSLSVE